MGSLRMISKNELDFQNAFSATEKQEVLDRQSERVSVPKWLLFQQWKEQQVPKEFLTSCLDPVKNLSLHLNTRVKEL